jgi:mono/diheme cytochrome c family protein
MKKILKFIGFTLLGVVLLLGIGATYIQLKGVPTQKYAPTPEILNLQVPREDSVMTARGLKIASVMCKGCHRGEDGKMSGNILADLPPVFGKVASLNITNDSVHGIANWTDGELYYFLRTGIRKNGSWAPPMMPKYNAMADDDVKAIIAWLRSDDPDLAPSAREYPANQWSFMLKFLSNTAFAPPPLPTQPISLPDTSDHLALGRYLANDIFACFHCHSGDFAKLDIIVPEKSFRYYGGGNPMLNMDGENVPTANITPHPEAGIGRWTEQQFIDAVKYCKKPGGGSLAYPMIPHATLTDEEVSAIFEFLKTVPPLDYAVERYGKQVNKSK